jgi:DNA-binding response OmpR family regulator
MSALKKKQILLVEDDAFIRKAYKAGLEASGFEVVIACDGNEALQKTREKHPCLILLDIVMAEKTGF